MEKKKRFNYKRCVVIFLLFILVMVIAYILKWPADFDSYVYVDNYKKSAHLHLFIYRLLQYFSFPFILAIYDKLHLKKGYLKSVVENFNLQFITYSLITGFVVTTIINKDEPKVLEIKEQDTN